MQVILGIFLLSFVLTAFGEQKISLMMTYILVMPCTCFGLYASLIMIKKGHTSAWFYILGAGALSLSVGFYLFYYAGYGIQNMPIRFNIYIGVSLEAFFLSLAVVYRVKDMRLANLNNQVLAIKSLEENQYMIIEQNAL